MKKWIFSVILVLPLLVVALAYAQKPAAQAETGRFQIVAQPSTNEVLGNVYLVDTTTGRVWREIDYESADGDDNGLAGTPLVWVPMTRLDSAKELYAFSARHPKK
jgi:hypothetical protein